MNELADQLIRIERKLNASGEMPLGSLLLDHWRFIYNRNRYGGRVRRLFLFDALSFVRFSIRFLVQRRTKIYRTDLRILLGRTARKAHYLRLIDFIKNHHIQSQIVDGDLNVVLSELSFPDRLHVYIKFCKKFIFNVRLVSRDIRQLEASISIRSTNRFMLDFAVNHVRYFASITFLRRFRDLEMLIVDYDRAKFAPLVAAANFLDIRTTTLQHGVINPPYGFYPVLAREMWVWGPIWRKMLVDMGLEESRIVTVGSTIVDQIETVKQRKQIRTIGIGPNPLGYDSNIKIWRMLCRDLVNLGYELVIKLHPSMKRDKQSISVFGDRSMIYETSEISNQEFFDAIDLLIVSNSGLGYEGVISGVPVAVVKEDQRSIGNDYVMISKGGFPELKHAGVNDVLEDLKTKLEAEWTRQKAFVDQSIYLHRGTEAKFRVLKEVDKNLRASRESKDTIGAK